MNKISEPKIKAILRITSRKRDTDGNTYHHAHLINTISGDSISFKTPAPCNATHELRTALGYEFGNFIEFHRWLGIREYDRTVKYIDFAEVYTSEETQQAIKNLFK